MQRREFIKNVSAVSVALSCATAYPQQSEGVDATPRHPDELNVATSCDLHKPQHALPAEEGYRYPADPSDAFLPKNPISIEAFAPVEDRIQPMPLAERLRTSIVPQRGFCSSAPGKAFQDTLLSGNGATYVELIGAPFSERLLFHHEGLTLPWRRPFEAPKVAYVLPEVRKLLLAGKYREGLNLAYEAMSAAGLSMNTHAHPTIPAFAMDIEFSGKASVKDYLRTVDFEAGEAKVRWTDPRGEWLRRTFASRPDAIVAQHFSAPKGYPLTAKITLRDPIAAHSISSPVTFGRDFSEDRLIFTGRFDPDVNKNGYACVTRIVRVGGSTRLEGESLIVENAASLTLLTRIEWFPDFSNDQVAILEKAVLAVSTDYTTLLERHRPIQASIIDRVSVNFGGAVQNALSVEELLTDQRTQTGYSPALLEKMFDMGRYWITLSSGRFPVQPIAGEVNINVNLQIAPGVTGNLPEAMNSYFDWIESLLPDCRKNAANIFGARGAVFPILPSIGMGVSFSYASTLALGIFPHPYWISAGGWCYSPFWDHYLVTGDLEFLRKRVVPGLTELALFYEDFLTVTDAQGNYVFVPSFSPENWPLNAEPLTPPTWPSQTFGLAPEPPTPLVINADMDIMVCREVLSRLIQASEILQINHESLAKWRRMLTRMPPYLLTEDGTLKEWSWPTLAENYNQRHVSHLYGVWPGDEIDPGRNPALAKAALLADRKRGPANSSAHGLCHRALAGARLKDSYLVNFELKQLLEQGYVGTTLRTSHNPFRLGPMPDAQGGIPAIIMEMLLYSRPGVIELLPALPLTLRSGSIRGLLARTFVKVDEFKWNLDTRTEELALTSLRKQEIQLMVWHGIESMSASEGLVRSKNRQGSFLCQLNLPANRPVTVKVKLARQTPLDWKRRSGLTDNCKGD